MATDSNVLTPERYKPVQFFALAYVATWIPWFIGAYATTYGSIFSLLGLIEPLAVALFMILGSGDPLLKRDFKDRLVNFSRIRPLYLLIAAVLPFAVMTLAIVLSPWLGQSQDQLRISADSNLVSMIALTMILAPIIEETAWRSYGVDSLRARSGMLKATLLFAILWSTWHAPLFLIAGTYQNGLLETPLYAANFFVSVIPAAIIANWLYYKNRRSIVAAIFLHSMLNASAVLFDTTQPTKCIATLLYAVVAVAIILIDPATFREGPRDFVHG
jgi:uncharacterized protein